MKNRKSAGPEESVRRDAKEVTAIEQYWHAAGRPKSRKPAKNYKYIDELAHLQFELIKLQEWVRLHGLKVAVHEICDRFRRLRLRRELQQTSLFLVRPGHRKLYPSGLHLYLKPINVYTLKVR